MTVEISLTGDVAAAIAQFEDGAARYVAALANETRARFQDNVHVVTGAMKASASVVTADGSDYAQNVAAAAALNPKASFAPEASVGPQEAIVQVPVDYAGWEELGSSLRPAHPALVPAIESVAADAERIARETFGL